MITPNYPLRGL